MRKRTSNFAVLAATALLAGAAATAPAIDWNWTNGAGDNLWETGGNWEEGSAPGVVTPPASTSQDPRINLAGPDKAIISSPTGLLGNLRMGQTADAELDIIEGAFLNLDTNTGSTIIGWNAPNTGTVNMSGGIFLAAQSAGLSVAENGLGFMNHSGGDVIAGRDRLRIGSGGNNSPGVGTYTLTGGTIQTRKNLEIGRYGIPAGETGATGIFKVMGSGATTISVGRITFPSSPSVLGGQLDIARTGVLHIAIDADGVTPIQLNDGTERNGDIRVEVGALLNVEALPGAPADGSWDAVICGPLGVVVGGENLVFHEDVDTDEWSFAFVEDEGLLRLRITRTGGASSVQDWMAY